MTAIPGLGPKKAILLYRDLGIADVEQLAQAVEQGRLAEVKGFGAKTEENIRRGIERMSQSTGRVLVSVAMDLADHFIERLGARTDVRRIEFAGSLRRMAETIGDLDLLVASDDAAGVMEAFTTVGMTERVLARGDTKSSILTRKGLQVDLRVVPLEAWGAAMIYFTGSKAHNIRIREMAVRKGLKLNEYGLYRAKSGKLIVAETEEEVYEKLSLPWIPPTLREDRGEVEAALQGTLPDVLVRRQLRGDLHTHTNLTDGLASLEQMLAAASELRYAYYAVTDHAPNLFMQRMTDEKMLAQRERLRALQSSYPKMTLLHGTELNIDAEGNVDWDADVEPLEEVGVPVHVALGADVELGPVQQGHLRVRGLQRPELLPLREHLLVRHPLHEQVRGVVRHRVVRVPQLGGCREHLFERGQAVREVGVRVQVAPQLPAHEHIGERALKRRLDLAAILAERGRDPRERELLVDLLLGLGDDELARLRAVQAVLVELETLAHGHLADPDVVGLRAGEVDHRRAPRLERDDAEVDLQTLSRQDRRLRLTAREHAFGHPDLRERLHHSGRVVARDQEVEVADRLGHPPERARELDPAYVLASTEPLDEVVREVHGDGHEHPTRRLAHALDAATDVLLGLGAEPLDLGQAALLDRLGELLDVRDPEVAVEQDRLLRTEARDRGHLANPRRDLRAQLLERLERAHPDELVDLLADRLAHARDLQDLLQVHRRQVVRIATHRPSGLLVRARLVGFVGQDRQEVGVFDQRRLDGVVQTRHDGSSRIGLRRDRGATA